MWERLPRRDPRISTPRKAVLQSDASKERLSIEDAVKSITDRRIQIQFAADGIWQSDNKANAPIRGEFQLSADRPFSG